MIAVVVSKFGGPEGLTLRELPNLEPGIGQVVIKVEAAAVGFQDAMIRSGALAAYGFKEGHILGGEVAGTITQVGKDVSPVWVGKRVWSMIGAGGGYAEQAVAALSTVAVLPDDLSSSQAVAIGGAGIVAHFALRHAHLTPDETVLVRGAAGPFGIMALQLALERGGKAVVATASSSERGLRLLEMGATHYLDRSMAEKTGTPGTFDVILDLVAGAELQSLFTRLNASGRIVSVGAVAGFPPPDFAGGMFPLFQKSLSFATFSAASIALSERMAFVTELFKGAAMSRYKAVIHDTFPLQEAQKAHELMERGSVFGRLVLRNDEAVKR